MRLLTLTAAMIFAGSASAYPPPQKAGAGGGPAVVFQVAPLGKALEEFKATIRSVAGEFAERAIQEMDAEFDKKFNTFDGFDHKKPIGGYVLLKDNPEDTGAVLVLPVADEKKFLESLGKEDRKATPVPGNAGLYKYDSDRDPAPLLTYLRFRDGYAYLSLNVSEKEMDVGSLVAADRLIDPKETAFFAAASAVDKIPPALIGQVRKGLFDGLAKWKQEADGSGPNAVAASTAVEALVRRQWTAVEKEGDQLGAKIKLDSKAVTLDQEYTLTGKPGTNLAKDIEAWAKPKENRFSGLADKSAAAHVFVKLPVFVPELKDLAAAGLAELDAKVKDQLPEPAQPLFAELVAGLNRTAKAGDADLAAVLHGPDKDGTFTAVVAVSFDDAPKVEAELKKFVKAAAPKMVQDATTWDVAKAGTANVHEVKIGDFLPAEAKKVFGEKAVLTLAFDRNAVFAAIGPDARAKATGAVQLKPTGPGTGPTTLADLAYNPPKILKLVEAVAPPGGVVGMFGAMLGKDDELLPLYRLTVAGGTKLTVNQTMTLRFFGWAFLGFRAGGP